MTDVTTQARRNGNGPAPSNGTRDSDRAYCQQDSIPWGINGRAWRALCNEHRSQNHKRQGKIHRWNAKAKPGSPDSAFLLF
jgi:hypothetical protein